MFLKAETGSQQTVSRKAGRQEREMYAAVTYGTDDIRFETCDTPVPGPGEVRVKVKFSGICGSDVPRVNKGAAHMYPMIFGHEFSGVVDAVGEGVTARSVGDRVVGVPLVPCLDCPDCARGDYALCTRYSFIGSRRQGSFAEYIVLPQKNVFPLDPGISFEKGALFEPATIGLHALFHTDFRGGKDAVVIGCGTVGLFTIQWLRIMGARRIAAVNRSREKLKLAGKMGASDLISTLDEDYMEQLAALTGGRGFDYVFDASGSEEMMQQDFLLGANKAKICMIGTPARDMTFPPRIWKKINWREMSVTGTWMSYSAPFPGPEWEMTSACLKNGSLVCDDAVIDRVLPLKDAADAFALYKIPGEIKGRVLLNCEITG